MKTKPHIIVVGAGLSGLMTTLVLAGQGARVSLLSLLPASRSDSSSFKHGISVLGNAGRKENNLDRHFADTIRMGEFLANQDLVRGLCESSENLIRFMEQMGVAWDKNDSAFLDGFSSEVQPLYSGFETGHRLLLALDSQVRKFEVSDQVQRFEDWEFLSLIRKDVGPPSGLVAMNQSTLELKPFLADALVFCTGGMGALYARSAQSLLSTGSAASILYQQGACLANLEFVHFHPLCLRTAEKDIVLGNRMFDEGARLYILRDGIPWYFLEEYYPGLGARVPSLVICRALHKLIAEPTWEEQSDPKVFLDLKPLFEKGATPYRENFFRLLKLHLGEPVLGAVPVFPSITYFLGGLWTDGNHMTNIPGVFAAGECQYHYHGANGVEGNMILSSLYSGQKAALGSLQFAKGRQGDLGKDEMGCEKELHRQNELNRALLEAGGNENPYSLYKELTELMRKKMGLVRVQKDLAEAESRLMELMERYRMLSLPDRGSFMNQSLVFARRLRNMLEMARVTVASALKRNESRGMHYKPEFPKRDDVNYLKTSKAFWFADGPGIEYEDVDLRYIGPSEKS